MHIHTTQHAFKRCCRAVLGAWQAADAKRPFTPPGKKAAAVAAAATPKDPKDPKDPKAKVPTSKDPAPLAEPEVPPPETQVDLGVSKHCYLCSHLQG